MSDPFIILHGGNNVIYYRANMIIAIEKPVPGESELWAGCVINSGGLAPRYVRETPEEVHALIMALDDQMKIK